MFRLSCSIYDRFSLLRIHATGKREMQSKMRNYLGQGEKEIDQLETARTKTNQKRRRADKEAAQAQGHNSNPAQTAREGWRRAHEY